MIPGLTLIAIAAALNAAISAAKIKTRFILFVPPWFYQSSLNSASRVKFTTESNPDSRTLQEFSSAVALSFQLVRQMSGLRQSTASLPSIRPVDEPLRLLREIPGSWAGATMDFLFDGTCPGPASASCESRSGGDVAGPEFCVNAPTRPLAVTFHWLLADPGGVGPGRPADGRCRRRLAQG